MPNFGIETGVGDMECPKCHKPVGDNDAVCKNCGLVLKADDARAKKSLFSPKKSSERKKEKAELSFLKGGTASRVLSGGGEAAAVSGDKGLGFKLKLFGIALGAIALIVLIIVIIVNVMSKGGEKTAEKLSDYINKPVTAAEDKLEIHLKEESDFDGVNNAFAFDYIYEADDDVKVDEVKYPEWAITVKVDDDNDITSVTYSNIALLEKNYKGIKTDGKISIDNYDEGDKLSKVLDGIGLDPYSVTYQILGKTYVFKYYYHTDNGDSRRVILTAVFDPDDKLEYITSTDVFPNDMSF